MPVKWTKILLKHYSRKTEESGGRARHPTKLKAEKPHSIPSFNIVNKL